jgi:hypothetical protein
MMETGATPVSDFEFPTGGEVFGRVAGSSENWDRI